jgi:hypothetical protein
LWGGAKPNVPMRGAKVTRLFNLFFSGARESLRLFKKKCAVGKIKNTEGLAMSVGLLAVPLQFGLYVVHLSKWFVCVFNV